MPDDKAFLAASILESIRLMAAHHGLWLAETVHQHGIEQALKAEERAGEGITALALKRLGSGANPFENFSVEQLEALREALAKLWLGVDGLWFQAVEALEGMDAAKRVNDTCWARFAPLEARRIKAMLGLPEAGGLEALEAALRQRFGSLVNELAFEHEPDALVLRTVNCRVQSARRRKGLADYPCRSGGVTEFTGFARFIDARITCECLACPPDPLPEGTYCSWRFQVVSGT